MISLYRGSTRPDTKRWAHQPATTQRPSEERTGLATRTPDTRSCSKVAATQDASAVLSTGLSTMSAQRKASPRPPGSCSGVAEPAPNAASTWAGGGVGTSRNGTGPDARRHRPSARLTARQ